MKNITHPTPVKVFVWLLLKKLLSILVKSVSIACKIRSDNKSIERWLDFKRKWADEKSQVWGQILVN